MQRDVPVAVLWLRVARADLDIATEPDVTDPFALGLRCYHAQQAAEKALKAVLVHHDAEVPRTHILADLLALLHDVETVPPNVEASRQLTVYATSTRYPDELIEATPKDQNDAADLASAVIEWAAGIVESVE